MMSEQGIATPSKGKVLFYRVEDSIMSILKREFIKSSIQVLEADELSPAKKLIKTDTPDVVLADYHPSKQGHIEFLSYIKEKYPSINRILLCETEYERAVINLVLKNVATSYFEKPHGIGEILDSVSRILNIRTLLYNRNLQRLLGFSDELSGILQTYYDFTSAIEADKSTRELSAILERDVSISTKVLKIANSAFYRSTRIGSVERACIYLGLETIKNIVFTVSLSSVKNMSSDQSKYMDRIIYHSLKVNQNFQRFYKLEKGESAPKNYTSIGITHDIGKLIMLQYLPDRFNKIVRYQKKNPDIGFYRSEIELGFAEGTHAEIGAYFLDMWNFPEVNIYTALFHHHPEDAFDYYRELMDIFSFVNEFAK